MKVLFINLDKLEYKIINIDSQGIISLGVKIHNEYESWKKDIYDPSVPFIFGLGPFVGGKLFGVHRMVAIFKSPLTRTLHFSSVGGVGYKFMGSGIDAIVIIGYSREPSVIFISPDNVKIESVNYVNSYKNYKGVYAFSRYLLEKYNDFFSNYNARAVVVGEGSMHTYNGNLFSFDIVNGEFRIGSEDFSGRGGVGSSLFKGHNILGIVSGGNYKYRYEKVNDFQLINKIFLEKFGKSYIEVINEKTKKYKYDPETGSGGTFGENYLLYKEFLPLFGYKSIYYSKELRRKHYENIIELFWKPFQEEVFIKSKLWFTCGDLCNVACKKVYKGKKVDYEPFHSLGPFVGNYIFEEALKLVDLVDQYGMDAIEVGYVISWLFDLIENKLLEPGEIGINDYPIFNFENFDPKNDSYKNSKIAEKIIEGLIKKNNEILSLISERGIRVSSKILNEKYKERIKDNKFNDYVVYASFGNEGYITPNLYWGPGVVAPMYILGKYWTDYSNSFARPEDFARFSYGRAINESLVEDLGICRFYRGVYEPVLDRLYKEITGKDLDKNLYKEIVEYSIKANAEPVLWESKRAMDLVSTMCRELNSKDWKFERYEDYVEWWKRFKESLDKYLGLKNIQ
jgi:glyceraldehyde-3-phosphate dehydrogenase (ferredoxin)